MVKGFIAALAVFAAYVAINAVVFNRTKAKRPLVNLAILFVLCAPLILAATEALAPYDLEGLLSLKWQVVLLALLVFTFLCYAYMQTYGLFELSISIRMLVHLYHAKERKLTLRELEALYPFTQVLERKIRMAIGMGFFRQVDGAAEPAYVITPWGRFVGWFFHGVKRFTRWGEGG